MIVRRNLFQILSIAKRELRMLFSNFSVFILLFAAPVAYSFLYTYFFVTKVEHDVPVTVIDNDHSELSRRIIRHLDVHELLKVKECHTDINQVYSDLQKLNTMAIMIIPENFERDVKSLKQSKISITINNTRFMITNDISKALNDVLSDEARNSTIHYFESKGLGSRESAQISNPIVLTIKTLFSTTESYGDFIIVGLLALIVLELLLISSAVSMAHENEMNSLNELFHKASGSVFRLFAGKALVYMTLFLVYAFFYFTFQFQFYKIPFSGSMNALLILTIVEFAAVLLLGMFIGTFLPSKLTALIVLVFSSYPIFLLSGYSWPIEALPEFLKICSYILPQTWFFQGYIIVTQDGGSLIDVIPHIMKIAVITIIAGLCFYIRIRSIAGKKMKVIQQDI